MCFLDSFLWSCKATLSKKLTFRSSFSDEFGIIVLKNSGGIPFFKPSSARFLNSFFYPSISLLSSSFFSLSWVTILTRALFLMARPSSAYSRRFIPKRISCESYWAGFPGSESIVGSQSIIHSSGNLEWTLPTFFDLFDELLGAVLFLPGFLKHHGCIDERFNWLSEHLGWVWVHVRRPKLRIHFNFNYKSGPVWTE